MSRINLNFVFFTPDSTVLDSALLTNPLSLFGTESSWRGHFFPAKWILLPFHQLLAVCEKKRRKNAFSFFAAKMRRTINCHEKLFILSDKKQKRFFDFSAIFLNTIWLDISWRRKKIDVENKYFWRKWKKRESHNKISWNVAAMQFCWDLLEDLTVKNWLNCSLFFSKRWKCMKNIIVQNLPSRVVVVDKAGDEYFYACFQVL